MKSKVFDLGPDIKLDVKYAASKSLDLSLRYPRRMPFRRRRRCRMRACVAALYLDNLFVFFFGVLLLGDSFNVPPMGMKGERPIRFDGAKFRVTIGCQQVPHTRHKTQVTDAKLHEQLAVICARRARKYTRNGIIREAASVAKARETEANAITSSPQGT